MIFKNDFTQFVTVTDAFEQFTFQKNIDLACDKYLKKLLNGEYQNLIAFSQNEAPTQEEEDKYAKLLSYCKTAIAHIVIADNMHASSAIISNSGITVRHSDNEKSAGDNRVNSIVQEFKATAFDALDMALVYIYENPDYFPAFHFKNSLIPTFSTFNNYYNAGSSIAFQAMQPIIDRVERIVKKRIPADLYYELVNTASLISVKKELRDILCLLIAVKTVKAAYTELPLRITDSGVFVFPFSESLSPATRRTPDTNLLKSTLMELESRINEVENELSQYLKNHANELDLPVPPVSSNPAPSLHGRAGIAF